MLARISFLTFAYVAVACSLVALVSVLSVPHTLEKTDRLAGAETPPAFVMERFAG